MIVAPYQIAFVSLSYFKWQEWVFLFLWERLIDVYFAVDIMLNFRSAHEDKEGQVVFDQRSVAFNYLTSWFIIDVVSTIPWDMLELFGEADPAGGASAELRLPKMLRLLRLFKLLKVLRASRLFKRWEQELVMTVRVWRISPPLNAATEFKALPGLTSPRALELAVADG